LSEGTVADTAPPAPTPQKPKLSAAFASKFGTSKAAAVLASFNAVPIPAGQAAVDAYARDVITKAGDSVPEHFYVFDLGAVLERWRTWTTSLPRVVPHYAVKCNPDRAMLALLAALGTGFDCASPAEIEMVRSLGVSSDRIVYAHCCKMVRDLDHARKVGVSMTTFDTEAELHKIAASHPGCGCILRIRADDPAARCNLGDKYGAEEDEILPLLQAARALNLDVCGISFHVGSGARSPAAFPIAVRKAREAFDAAIALGFRMRILDLGGGYSGNLTEGITMAAVAQSLNDALEAHFPVAQGVRVIAEPGRFFAEPGMTLHTRVFGKRVRENRGPGVDTRYYWIADGVYGSMNCQIYDHAVLAVRPFPVTAPTEDAMATDEAVATLPSTLYGPTCDGMDTLLRGCPLPDLPVGAWLQWPSMGAYTLAAGSAFNGFDSQKVAVHYVFSEEAKA
jgi:ornithine decarboxylase